jgi:hypothetical protein
MKTKLSSALGLAFLAASLTFASSFACSNSGGEQTSVVNAPAAEVAQPLVAEAAQPLVAEAAQPLPLMISLADLTCERTTNRSCLRLPGVLSPQHGAVPRFTSLSR